jgi:hypothetical protein
MDNDFVFDPSEFSNSDGMWILKYCLNLMADTSRFIDKLNDLFIKGETGGDIDWGIHRWGELTGVDYGVEKFEGYRAYMGSDEHRQGHDEDIEVYVDEDTIKNHLMHVCDWYVQQHAECSDEIAVLRAKFDI